MVITPTLQAEEVQECDTNGAVIHFMCDIHKCCRILVVFMDNILIRFIIYIGVRCLRYFNVHIVAAWNDWVVLFHRS